MSRVNPRLCLIAWARRASIFARECSAYIRTAVSLVPQVSRGKPNRSYTPPDQISELSLKSHSQQPECSAPVCPVVCGRTASTAAAFRTAPSSNLFGCSIRGQLCWSGSGPKRFPRRQKTRLKHDWRATRLPREIRCCLSWFASESRGTLSVSGERSVQEEHHECPLSTHCGRSGELRFIADGN